MEEKKPVKQQFIEAWKFWTQPAWMVRHFIVACMFSWAIVFAPDMARQHALNRHNETLAIVSSVAASRARMVEEARLHDESKKAESRALDAELSPEKEQSIITTKPLDSQNSSKPDYTRSPDTNQSNQSTTSKSTFTNNLTTRKSTVTSKPNGSTTDANNQTTKQRVDQSTTANSKSSSTGSSAPNTTKQTTVATKQTTASSAGMTTRRTRPSLPPGFGDGNICFGDDCISEGDWGSGEQVGH